MTVNRVAVLLNDLAAGELIFADGQSWFRFSESYRRADVRPVLGQAFEDDLNRNYKGKTGALPPFFANLLPEGMLRALLVANLGIPADDDFGLLLALGGDLPGAIIIQESKASTEGEEAPPSSDSHPGTSASSEHDGLRFSLAGVQLKLSMALAASKLTLPAHNGAGDWIVKFWSPQFPGLVENEFSVLTWARCAGFDVPECQIVAPSALDVRARKLASRKSVLAIKRYDRVAQRRIHQEDFAQVANLQPSLRYDHWCYEDIALLAAAVVGTDGASEVLRRLVFMIASGNSDGHLKNWSLLYRDGISASLAPLYDQVSTIAWPDLTRQLALKLGGKKQFAQLDMSSFSELAERLDWEEGRVQAIVRNTLESTATAWATVRHEVPLIKDHVLSLARHWEDVPLLRDFGAAPFGPAVRRVRPRRRGS